MGAEEPGSEVTGASMEVVDLVFGLRGGSVVPDYADDLWSALLACLPWLGEVEELGVHPLAGMSPGGAELYLSRHSRLILRLPRGRCDAARALQGVRLEIGGTVEVAAATVRPLLPATVVHAGMVALDEEDEARFLARCRDSLAAIGIAGDLLCGKRRRLGGRVGYSVMVRDVSPDDSLRLQWSGIGTGRRQGCGIFVPHKSTDPVSA